MRLLPTLTPAALILIGLTLPGCGSADAASEAATAARILEMDTQNDQSLQDTLAVIAETEAAMQPRPPSPALTYDAFRGTAIDPDADANLDPNPDPAPAPAPDPDTQTRAQAAAVEAN